ncbi:hypothetical protein OBRU01_22659, partial [Operophtera brumata]
MTYKEMLQKIVNIATGLKSTGLKRGDVVGLCSENSSEYIAVTVAASCLGATAALKSLLKTFEKTSHIKHIIQINGTAVSKDVRMLHSLEVTADVHAFNAVEVDTVNDTAFIYYSSGTTGLPKGVALTHLPTIVVILAKSPQVQNYDLSSVKLIWCAAAPLGAETITQAMKNLPGCKGIFQAYGMTETSLAVVKEPESKRGKSGSCGLPLPGTLAKPGEICLKGPTLMKGYVDNEEATKEMFDEEGFIKTGDIGYYDADGWFYVVDRIKELIKYNGQQVAPAAVETVILEHNGVAECGVVGTPDELAGELPTAFVLSPASRLRGGVIFINEIPRNGSGKILRLNIAVGLKDLGVKPGDVVGVCGDSRSEYIAAAMGAVCCGAIATFEMVHVLNISRPCIIFCTTSALKAHLSTFEGTESIQHIVQVDGDPTASGVLALSSVETESDARCYEAAEVRDGKDTAMIFYSSGTTGLPKGVMLSHINILYIFASYQGGYSVKHCNNFLTILPWYHVYGLISSLIILINHKQLVCLSGFNPEKYLNLIQEYQINCLMLAPPVVVFIAKSPLVEKYDTSSVEGIWCGAAPLSEQTMEQLRRRMPNFKKLIEGYGMTETTMGVLKCIDEIEAKRGLRPIPGVKVKIVDCETREKLGPNEK